MENIDERERALMARADDERRKRLKRLTVYVPHATLRAIARSLASKGIMGTFYRKTPWRSLAQCAWSVFFSYKRELEGGEKPMPKHETLAAKLQRIADRKAAQAALVAKKRAGRVPKTTLNEETQAKVAALRKAQLALPSEKAAAADATPEPAPVAAAAATPKKKK